MTNKLALALVLAGCLSWAQEPDNTKKNQRDRTDVTATADKQSNNKNDMKLTQSIRRDLTQSDTLSVYAKNVKIVTQDGRVTLRGPVKTAEEKASIEAIAKKHAGDAAVTNLLEVAPPKS